MGFEFKELKLKGAYIINCFYVGDNRGGFTKCFEKDIFGTEGIIFNVSEVFMSKSMKNVIRGLHFQTRNPQAKLVSVVSGKVWDVIVDLRPDSNTFMQWTSYVLSSDNHLSIFVPRGFAHGFACLEDETIMMYQCDGKYDKESDSGIIYNDPEIGIDWPITKEEAIFSPRDLQLNRFSEYILNPMAL